MEIAMRNDHEPQEKSIQHVILETTGLADPTPILQLITQGADRKGTDDIVKNYVVNGIITLVDCKHFYQSQISKPSQYKNELIAQISTTDCILLNKADLVSSQELENIEKFIRGHNSNVKLYPTTFADLDLDILDLEHTLVAQQTNEEAVKKHDPAIEQTMLLASGAFVDLSSVQDFIKNTTIQYPEIYRVKGILYLQENPNKKYIIQGVAHDQLSILEGNAWEDHETKESRITLIGKNVMAQCNQLEAQFRKCLL